MLISACLLGLPTRYDGSARPTIELIEYALSHPVIPICPEQLGGLPTPRPVNFLVGGTGKDVLRGRAQVLNKEGKDVTSQFLKGAELTAQIARLSGAKKAILKARSPSCGVRTTSCQHGKTNGPGVTAALLKKLGLQLLEADGYQ